MNLGKACFYWLTFDITTAWCICSSKVKFIFWKLLRCRESVAWWPAVLWVAHGGAGAVTVEYELPNLAHFDVSFNSPHVVLPNLFVEKLKIHSGKYWYCYLNKTCCWIFVKNFSLFKFSPKLKDHRVRKLGRIFRLHNVAHWTKSQKIHYWHLGISLKLINSDNSLLPSFISASTCKIFFLGAF